MIARTAGPCVGDCGGRIHPGDENESGPGGATNTVIPGPNHYQGVAMTDATRRQIPDSRYVANSAGDIFSPQGCVMDVELMCPILEKKP